MEGDLLPKIKGLFRLLDLHTEQGISGLVDKIIIAQDSLKALIDTLSFGAYTSITKIDFSTLDNVRIKAIGIYGSKPEIVRLLRKAGDVDNKTANLLLLSDDNRKPSQSSLRSGIYLFLPTAGVLDLHRGAAPTVHIIYWPEDTTWNDTASGGVKRNRVTLMRYLTCLTDQIRILASPEHTASLVWKEDDSDSDSEDEKNSTDETDSEDEDDRFFKFEVAKTHEQEENAQVHNGFVFKHQAIGLSAYQQGSSNPPNQETIPPTLVAGETRQGFMIAAIVPGRDEHQQINGTFSRVRLASTLKNKRVYLEQSINEDALAILMSEGELSSRVPDLHIAHSIEEQVRSQLKNQGMENRKLAVQHLRDSLDAHLTPQGTVPDLILSTVRKCSGYHSYESTVVGHSTFRVEPVARYRIWPMELMESDKVTLRDNPLHVSRPRARYQSVEFTLPMDHHIRHVQLLRDDHYLVVADSPGGTRIWLQSEARPFALKATKQLPLPSQYVMAVDESKRLVSFVCMDNGRCTLNVFVMDEELNSLSGRGTPHDVAQWYTDGPAQIQLAVFFSGTEELCLIEKSGRARIYSFLSQGFRPASIQFPASIEFAQAAPDASALLVVERTVEGSKQIIVHHRASFGNGKSPYGIVRDLPAHFSLGTQFAVTSLGQQNVSLLALLPDIPAIGSVSVEISRTETDYQFREKKERGQLFKMIVTKHNSLLNCLFEVWGRYPVVPAIKRETLSADGRLDAAVTFVTDYPTGRFTRYFKGIVREFKRLSRKPTDRRLDNIQLEYLSFNDIDWDGGSGSVFRAGEWLVELLCLIPIRIAIALENRFVPLKDGVFDSRLEQHLLGAEVPRIIDTLSLGWYESIFGWYAAKEVKVISLMGEQSVGKSYCLDHLVDSSFAGPASYATDGVWLSVCPSKDTLVVALNFKGIHSIERTAQEDMLLVLFNTALSNLVIFRNNFALSRDVANMFTSFQASVGIFDQAANPRLFQGCLAVVIKDVVDGDKKEIVQEFKMKFSQIVGQEQANNFITKLHAGQLTVIPWNVIESREFYALFPKLSKQLFEQKTTHASAGEFLMTIKTLMAKLKAQDWSATDPD